MARKRYSAAQIIGHLRQAEILIFEGKTIGEAARQLSISEQTYYRWRREYGGMEVDQARRLKELDLGKPTVEEAGRRPGSGHLDPEGGLPGKLLSPTRRRQAVGHVCQVLTVSERRACRVLGQVRRTQRYTPRVADDEAVLTANIVSLASEYERYGYRRITALLTAGE